MIMCGEGKPPADMAVLQPIATAPKDRSVIGAWVSMGGRLLGEEPVFWCAHDAAMFDPEDCPVNIADWQGWSTSAGNFVFPSHWRSI